MWFQLRSPELAEDFERLMAGDRDIVRGSLDTVSDWRLTRRTYASKSRQYLAWLADAELDGDPLGSAEGRDWAVRDYRNYLQAVLKRKPATVKLSARGRR
jgi:hypothetical protein